VIEEYLAAQKQQSEPAYKAELTEERRRREQLERRVNELVEENRRSREAAAEAERQATIRAELQRLGVNKVDLAFRVIKDDIQRSDDGRLVAQGQDGAQGIREYLQGFLSENPEFLPARIAGGSGLTAAKGEARLAPPVDLDKIRPGMSGEELQHVREHIAQIATQALRGE
jgi:hypothetical protein